MWSDADIVNAALAGVGLVAGSGGLWFAYKAFGAAETASQAARAARDKITQRVTAADLGSVRTALDAFQNQLRASQQEAALLSCQNIRRQLVALRSRPGLDIPVERRRELGWAITTLRRLREALEEPEPQLNVASTNSEVERIIDLVVEWEETPLSLEKETSDHE